MCFNWLRVNLKARFGEFMDLSRQHAKRTATYTQNISIVIGFLSIVCHFIHFGGFAITTQCLRWWVVSALYPGNILVIIQYHCERYDCIVFICDDKCFKIHDHLNIEVCALRFSSLFVVVWSVHILMLAQLPSNYALYLVADIFSSSIPHIIYFFQTFL